ncbi:MAG: dihydroxy-acid dehydratase [Deltaproteobacteria bacterium]|nr:dihydroxy-acid dehydratase [Deltaproteobacteria bacterium]
MKYRSWDTTRGLERGTHRALYMSMGYSAEDLTKPMIGIANAWSTVVPGHFNLREISESVKEGIRQGGGTPVEFGVIGACDGIAEGHIGTRYILPTRELIANDIEAMVEAHRFDGLVLLGSCDKIVPGMLMAAARLDIPAILVNGGPALGGMVYSGKKCDVTALVEALGRYQVGEITEQELRAMEDNVMPTCGSCSMLGTANTMGCVSEALGMTLPGTGVIPAVYAARKKAALESGEQIVKLVEHGITSRKIISAGAIKNAIRLSSAIGGSTNVALHIPAIAYEALVDFSIDMFEKLSDQTPLLVKINPAGPANVPDFHDAGGVQAVLKELEHLLDGEALTVTGKTVAENLSAVVRRSDREVIRSIDDPYSESGGLAVLWGNLAQEGAITKPAAIDPATYYFQGHAKVFDSEAETNQAIMDGKVQAGDVVVVRYEGPKGGPGMPEMFRAMKLLNGMGLAKKTALITDGRFSGTNNGCFVGHISPEATEGGTLAVVENGDTITIDITKRNIHLDVSEEELAARFKKWERPAPRIESGYLRMYARLARSASYGAIIPHREL